MRRLADRWWLIWIVLVLAVLVVTRGVYVSEAVRHQQQERAAQREVVTALGDAVDDVLSRELALAAVIQTEGPPTSTRWPALANIVTSAPSATGTAFIVPLPERGRAAFERRTGLPLLESPTSGVLRPAGRRALHLVVVDGQSKSGPKPVLGLDLATSRVRRDLMLATARTRRALATPPVWFLGRAGHRRGVIVYAAVFGAHRQLEGWVSASYAVAQLTSIVAAHTRGVALAIRDGASTLVSTGPVPAGPPGILRVAGRRWRVWAATPGTGISSLPWLVLGLGLGLATAVGLIARQLATRERYAARRLAEYDAEEAALARIATLVAQGAVPDAVFASVAEELGRLLGSKTAAVSRFDPQRRQGVVLGGWSSDQQELAGTLFDLDGVTSSAEVYRTGKAARLDARYFSATDPVAGLMSRLGATGGIAAPIVVDGQLWGALGSAYGTSSIPVGAERRLERFGRLVGLAIANADAREKLDHQASTDALTAIPNRRVFEERLRSELARTRRHDRDLSLALFDLDEFKQINDVHGHQAGDRMLISFAQALSDHARHGDVIARVGGEEFAWLMPETDQDGALIAAERLRNAIEQQSLESAGRTTVSAGIVSAKQSSSSETLFHDADLALYEAKRTGRNRATVHASTTSRRSPGSSSCRSNSHESAADARHA